MNSFCISRELNGMDSPNTHCLPQDGPHTSSRFLCILTVLPVGVGAGESPQQAAPCLQT